MIIKVRAGCLKLLQEVSVYGKMASHIASNIAPRLLRMFSNSIQIDFE